MKNSLLIVGFILILIEVITDLEVISIYGIFPLCLGIVMIFILLFLERKQLASYYGQSKKKTDDHDSIMLLATNIRPLVSLFLSGIIIVVMGFSAFFRHSDSFSKVTEELENKYDDYNLGFIVTGSTFRSAKKGSPSTANFNFSIFTKDDGNHQVDAKLIKHETKWELLELTFER
ncbi:MAG: hypothetical protein R8G66_26985 [Cytophagales bacterium]|nr:hypothetical protein [Cytophagales bacterium]